ncbi:Protein translocase subunit SecD [Zhongshania aliphaticivorans]|uniref:Protein translocase subunit SecD n=1 Tax=Zhongshania aliphaticivorans TaxID=1470434 RepID=A0A5S9NE23_9GAMM|nr:protein translocase subunit SecD [Zhongshania aliphaticivorans]CAA0087990.1 Protein translocase subunit SecD [Zhongshania aliphaticivorans]CAA0115756.1 Protein translocase subunit SecD [Zhongshania aliphaticivorans]CAA0120300.1 Protein translocase subunit SecD [Zhongshania aliphaticivorans]
MLNKYPLWKNLLILAVLGIGLLYAIPNLYRPDPALQVSGESSGVVIDQALMTRLSAALDAGGIEHFGEEANETGKSGLVRLYETDVQLRAQSIVQRTLGDGYVVALNLASNTPDWLSNLGAQAMKLGLDLSGGVHFLLEVDTDSAIETRLEHFSSGIKKKLREERIRGFVTLNDGVISGKFTTAELRDTALKLIRSDFAELTGEKVEMDDESFYLRAIIGEAKRKEIEDYAVSQNLTTLRNRVNELGVSEPLVQRQGRNRIVVELPGIQDTAEAKRILGKTANLDFRLEAKYDAPLTDREQFEFRNPGRGEPSAWLERDVVITGERVANAQAGFDQNGMPQVNITLDSQGGTLMHKMTRHNINRRLGVLFIERKSRTHYQVDAEGVEQIVKVPYDEKKIISLATIKDALGVQFRITGLDAPGEAAELSLLLRAGALAAPIDFVEERTVGPSLGAENISKGLNAVKIGLGLVALFMLVYYRVFGVIAVVALGANIILLTAAMSLLGATLTLPGIAGIVLTVGMAVDANVLIFSRIREELRAGLSVQHAIEAGYGRAFVTIMDSNVTTLLVAVILYAVGTGPVRGFAVTLSLGILTSMFTAIMGTRAIVNFVYGGRRITKLAI